jgi:hypothetical protein
VKPIATVHGLRCFACVGGALNSNAPVFKKEPGQKQQDGKDDHGQSKRTGLLAGAAWKIRSKTVPKFLPPRHFCGGR